MLMASAPSGILECADSAARSDPHWCPECAEEVILKRGPIVVAHYAHRVDSGCVMSKGESLRHLEMKMQIGRLFPNSQFEVRFGAERRADVVLEDERVVIECQASSIDIWEIQSRTWFYNSEGYSVLWIFDMDRIGQGWHRSVDGIAVQHETRVPADLRYVHQAAYGFLYVLDEFGNLHGCHLGRASARDNDFGSYTPKTLKWVSFHRAGRVPIKLTSSVDDLTLVKLGEGVWWKEKRTP